MRRYNLRMSFESDKTPVLLMVSGGSDSMALLELAYEHANGGAQEAGDPLLGMLADALPARDECALYVLHVNHLLRGSASDEDEAFVIRRCGELGLPCEVQRVDIAKLPARRRGGMEAVAREERYRLAEAGLARACASERAEKGIICSAHTLDDRIETFFMRALVGTGPGGLASIPRARGNVRRPLLEATREQLRDWLRSRHPNKTDAELWREDESNMSGENFRSKVRIELMPVLEELCPHYRKSLAQTMDLIADENDALQQQAESIVYRSLDWDGETARIACSVLADASRPMARRVLRACLLVVNPEARLEAEQIERVLDNAGEPKFSTEVSGGLRVSSDGSSIVIRQVQ